jgi:hypothetical protein
MQIPRDLLFRASMAQFSLLFPGGQKWGVAYPWSEEQTRDYELTVAGRKRLCEETDSWNRLASAIASVLSTQPEEV